MTNRAANGEHVATPVDELGYLQRHNRNRQVHVVDADPANYDQLALLFRHEGFNVICSNNFEQFVLAESKHPSDVVVSNMAIGESGGLQVLRRVRAAQPGAVVIMIADTANTAATVMAMKMGATDVLARPFDSEELLRAVRQELRRDIQFGAVVNGRRSLVVRGYNQLTAREREVMQVVVDGMSNKEAARELGISSRTVEVHRARVMDKMGARNTAELVRIVLSS